MHLHTAAPNTTLCPGDPRPDPLQGKISPDIQPDPHPERLKAISPHPVAATGVHRPTLTSPQPPFRSCGSNEVSSKAWEMLPWAVQRDRVEKRVSVFKPGACLGHGTVCCPSPCVHPLCTSARCYPRSAGPISLPTSALFRPGLNALRPCSAITLTTPFCRPRMWAPYIDRPPIQPQPALSEPAPPPPPGNTSLSPPALSGIAQAAPAPIAPSGTLPLSLPPPFPTRWCVPRMRSARPALGGAVFTAAERSGQSWAESERTEPGRAAAQVRLSGGEGPYVLRDVRARAAPEGEEVRFVCCCGGVVTLWLCFCCSVLRRASA